MDNLYDLFKCIQENATRFGFSDNENGLLRDCISNDSKDAIRELTNDEHNFWFGFIREDQPKSGAYEGLSFVVMPEANGDHCLVSIGIGSNNVGPDRDLASNVAFRRSFLKLTKKDSDKEVAKFYFKLRIDEMETPILELKEELSDEKYFNEMRDTVNVYNEKRPGLLPISMIVNYKKREGLDLIIAWLAQYAKWRNWSSYKNGSIKKGQLNAINVAINKCINEENQQEPGDIKNILLDKRFVVLQGAPGCGKTWSAKEIAKDDAFDEVEFIQFHAETTYADFIYGIKPILNGTSVAYEGEKGALLRILDKALKNKEKKYLLIIDEINRANLANVLGPVFFLFEQTNNETSNLKLNLGKIKNEDGSISNLIYTHIPNNLYVLATMNTADKSLAVVDFALRRRFSWITLKPHKLKTEEFDSDLFDKVAEIFFTHATDEELNLQPGQSYFMNKEKKEDAIKYGLMPLMKEYFAEGFLHSAIEPFSELFYNEGKVIMYE